jgi:hypothetical protein
MATSSSLLKSGLNNSIAEGLYKEIQSNCTSYYYFLGRTLEWNDNDIAPTPIDSFNYELETRNEIITLKQVKSTDVAFVIPRVDWQANVIYDQFDDQYCDEIQGIDIISGGFGYADPPTITISGGGGTGATAVATITEGAVVAVTLTSRGRGYTSVPDVTISGGGGEGFDCRAVIARGVSGTQRIENANMFVLTDEFHVYKCLDNNQGAESTYKPIGTVVAPVIMPDGYMWKYLYTIPIALRNKFLTESYMPVINSLKQQFYSDGEILAMTVDNEGEGYTFMNVTVTGDGYRESDPLLLNSITVSDGGASYSAAPTVVIDPPYTDAAIWSDGNTVLLGQKIQYGYNQYQVTKSGILSTPAPTHTRGTVDNGSAALKYIGTQVTGTATVSSGEVTGITLDGIIYDIEMTDGGEGYTSAPTVNISGGGGSGQVLSAVMSSTSVMYVSVLQGGSGFTSVPTVTFGTQWTASTAVSTGDQIYYTNRLYTVTVGGTTGTTAPTHNSSTAANGTATLEYVGSPATGDVVLKYGSGYQAIPNVSFQPTSGGTGAEAYLSGSKSEAKIFPVLDNGHIDSLIIQDGGVGYTYANITITGDGTSAELTADLSPGSVDTLQANTELLTVAGQIMSCVVISGGYGYGTAPTVTIEGDGTGAEAIAHVEDGRVTKIEMTNYGQGYRWANVSISTSGAGLGYAATARAVMTPYGGHGKDPINGTYASTLMFYTNISKDKNQGFDVNNDFRQLGLLKHPRKYSHSATDYASFKETLGSACYVLTGSINTSTFTADKDLYLNGTDGAMFRIVASTTTGVLVQALENAEPNTGDVMVDDDGNQFTVGGVTEPTVDKYSGDILFIDNKQAFTPTEDQTVTLRTVIKF